MGLKNECSTSVSQWIFIVSLAVQNSHNLDVVGSCKGVSKMFQNAFLFYIMLYIILYCVKL